MQYQGYEPGPPETTRAEEHEEDCESSRYRWRQWLARRGYLNRTPRDRGFRRHQRARVLRRKAPVAKAWFGSGDARAVSKLQGMRLSDEWWNRRAAERREARLREQDAADTE